ncbi:hypothetical protein R3I94_007724 [Phoxinus phoxinus]
MDKVLLKSKTKLIRWLKLDWIIILQHVQEHEFITTQEYDNLMITAPTEGVIKLLDIIHGKGENVCRNFLNLLKNDDVNEFSPELRKWIKTVDTSVQKPDKDWEKREAANRSIQETANTAGQSGIQVTSNISASDGGHVFSPIITGSTLGSFEMNMTFAPSAKSNVPANFQKHDRDCERRENCNRSIQDYQTFLKANTSQLVQKVKNIDPILDDLDLHKESVANVRAKSTRQKKMRELLDCVNCESIAKNLVNALFKHEESLMKELQY